VRLPPVAQGSPPAAPALRSRRVPSARHNRILPAQSWCWMPTVVRRSAKAAHALRSSPPPNRKKPQRHSRLGCSRLARHRQGIFFYGRADPSLAHRLLDGVELHSQRLGIATHRGVGNARGSGVCATLKGVVGLTAPLPYRGVARVSGMKQKVEQEEFFHSPCLVLRGLRPTVTGS
jgi:hypothetical protein